eukprot:COSAG06_NODE_4679_length_4042_cov_4.646704_4_plen_47_part_00
MFQVAIPFVFPSLSGHNLDVFCFVESHRDAEEFRSHQPEVEVGSAG